MWGLLFLVAIISLFFSVDIKYSLNSIRGELIKGVMLFFIGLHIISTQAALARLWRIVLLGIIIMSLAGIILFLPQIASWTDILKFSGARAKSLCRDYGHFATYFAIILPYLLVAPRAFNLKGPTFWFIWVLVFALAMFAAYITYNRILWFCIPSAAILYFWFLSRRRLLAGLMGAILLLTIAVCLINATQHSHGEKWEHVWGSTQKPEKLGGTAGDLLKVWIFSFEKLRTNPLVGVGFGKYNFGHAYPEFVQANHTWLSHNHNVFMDTAIQTGIQGLLAFLAMLTFILVRLWPHAPPKPGDILGCFRLATVIMIFSYMLRNQTDSFFVNYPALLFWLLIGLALASYWLKVSTNVESPG